MALTTFADGRLWGARYGAGAPWLLALHGWRRDHRDFDPVLSGLDAIALDLPGHGVATEPPEVWSTRRYADWVAPVLDELSSPAVVVGHSFGGRVALQLAAAQSTRVAALVITGTPLALPEGGRTRPAVAFRAARAANRVGLVSEARMERARQRYGSHDYRAARGVMRGVLVTAAEETASGSYVSLLARYPGKVELVWGEEDDQAPLSGLRAVGAACPGATVTVVPGVGHFTLRRAPEAVRAALLRHAPALPAGPGR